MIEESDEMAAVELPMKFGSILKNWSAYLVVATPFIAYGVGRLTVIVFASQLGISATELGLNNQEYILIATLYMILWLIVGVYLWSVGIVWFYFLEFSKRRYGHLKLVKKEQFILYSGMLILTIGILLLYREIFNLVFTNTSNDLLILGIISIVTVIGLVAYNNDFTKIMAGIFALTMIMSFSLIGASEWGDQVVTEGRRGPEAEFFLPSSLVIQPKPVIVIDGDSDKCVVLLTDNTYFYEGYIHVEKLDHYVPVDCVHLNVNVVRSKVN